MVHRFAGSVASGFGEVSRNNISAAPAASMGGMNAIMPRVIKALVEKTSLKFGANLSNALPALAGRLATEGSWTDSVRGLGVIEYLQVVLQHKPALGG